MKQHTRSTKPKRTTSGISRRTFLKSTGAGLAGAAGVAALRPRISVAAPVTLSIWTGFPEIEAFYKKAAEEYAKKNPGFKLETLSSQLREMEQKIAAVDPDRHRPRPLRHRAEHHDQPRRREPPPAEPAEGHGAAEEQGLPPGGRRVQHVEGPGLRHPVPGGLEAGALLQHEDVQGGRARPQQAADDLRRADDLRPEAHEEGRRRKPDPRRHQPAPLGPGLGRRGEVLVRALRHGRRSGHPDQVRQVAQQLRQRRRAGRAEVLHRRRPQVPRRRPEAPTRHGCLRQRAGGDAHARGGRHRRAEGEGAEGRVQARRPSRGPSAGAA